MKSPASRTNARSSRGKPCRRCIYRKIALVENGELAERLARQALERVERNAGAAVLVPDADAKALPVRVTDSAIMQE